MKTTRILLLVLLLASAPSVVLAQFSYTTNADGISATITGCTGSGGAVVIPSNINSLTVNNIGTDAFLNNATLTSVTIPGSITNIGFSAFYGCTALTNVAFSDGLLNIGGVAFLGCASLGSISIPGSVANIGASAFSQCPMMSNATIANGVASIGEDAFSESGLSNIFIPASVTNIGPGAFSFCTNLAAIDVDANNPAYCSADGVLFDITQAILVAYPGATVGSCTVSNGVTAIGASAFQGCSGLTLVTISSTVTNIGDNAFSYCSNLTNITISDSVVSIGTTAFCKDSRLTSVAIPASLTSIGPGAFSQCGSLKAINVDPRNPAYCSINGVLFDITQATLVECPSGLIGNYTIPGSVTNIADYAFSGCLSLTNAAIPSSVISIGNYAFYNFGLRITNVTIPASVTSVGTCAFAWCPALKNVYFLGSAPTLGANAFVYDNMKNNSPLYCPTLYYFVGAAGWGSFIDGCQASSLNPFRCATNAGGITITSYIGGFGNVVIPATINGYPVTGIATNAFANLASLTSVTIAGSVTNIANSAFSGCSNLTSVVFSGNAPTAGSSVFASDTNVTVYYLANCAGWNSTFAGVPAVTWTPNDRLGAANLLVGSGAGSNTVVLATDPRAGAWTATANAPWLHLTAANQSGVGSTNVVFSYDANLGATRSGTLTLGYQTLTVTQAGSTYVAARLLTALVSSNLSAPWGVAVDAAGNVYIGDSGDNAIKKWTRANNSLTTLVSTGLNNPTALAVDSAGSVYFDDTYSTSVKKWTAGSGNVTTLVSSLGFAPYGVAVDGAGNVYIDDTGNNNIKELTADGGNLITLAVSGLFFSSGVAVDVAGNAYIGNSGFGSIIKWTAANNTATALHGASGVLASPQGTAVDGSGNVYFANQQGGAVMIWTAANSAVTTLAAQPMISRPSSTAVDGAGNVYIADSALNAILEIPYAFVDPAPRSEGISAGSDALPSVLPSSADLLAPFAPASDQPWLAITGVANGIVSFSFTANSGAARTAHINLLGQSISITQSGVTPPSLTGAQMMGNGAMQFAFTNTPGATFTILSSTNLSLPLANWTVAGTAFEISPGLFQFTSQPTTNDPARFYTVRAP